MNKLFLLLAFLMLAFSSANAQVAGLAQSSGPVYSCVNMLGDSITDGLGSSTDSNGGNGAKGYAWQIINAYGGCGTNYAYSGDQAGDMSVKAMFAVAPTVSGNALTAMMASTNDYDNYGTNTTLQGYFQATLENAIVWAAIPDVAKLNLYNQTTDCTFTGSGWYQQPLTVANGYPAGAGDATNGDYATCTFTMYETGPLYISYTLWDTGTVAATQALTVSVDGGTATSFTETSTGTISTFNGLTSFPVIGRIAGPFTGSAAGTTHTIKITNTGPTGGSPAGYMLVHYLAAPYPNSGPTPPKVFVGGTPWENANTNSSLVTAYNTLIQSVVSTLAGDGLPVTFVNVQANLNTTTDFAGGTLANGYVCPSAPSGDLPLHPGDCGHTHLAQSFLALMPNAYTSGPVPGNQLYYGPVRAYVGGASAGYFYTDYSAWHQGNFILPSFQNVILGPSSWYWDDFISLQGITAASIGSPTGASCNTGGSAATNAHPGVFKVVSGTVSSAGEACVLYGNNPSLVLNGGVPWLMETEVEYSVLPATTATSYQFGAAASPTTIPWGTTSVSFYLSSANSNKNDIYCGVGTSLVDSTVTAVANTWYRLSIWNDGSVIHFFINGVDKTACDNTTSTVSSTAMVPGWTTESLTTTTENQAVDYFWWSSALYTQQTPGATTR